jgi:hypothetical protein
MALPAGGASLVGFGIDGFIEVISGSVFSPQKLQAL